jgi:hypothetical protein
MYFYAANGNDNVTRLHFSPILRAGHRNCRINGRMSLNSTANHPTGNRGNFPIEGGNYSRRNGLVEAERITDGKYFLANLEIF